MAAEGERFRPVRLGRSQHGGANDGGAGGVEVRISKLEFRLDHNSTALADLRVGVRDLKGEVRELRGDVTRLGERMTRVETKIEHLPGKGFFVTGLVVALSIMTGVLTVQEKLRSAIGAAPYPQSIGPAPPAATAPRAP